MALSPTAEIELLNKVRDIHAVFIGIEGQPGRFQDLTAIVSRQGKRITATERFQYVLTGMGLILSVVACHFEHLLSAVIELKKMVPAVPTVPTVPADAIVTGFLHFPPFWPL